MLSWQSLQMSNVNSVFAGILRAGLPALLQQTVALLNQPDTLPEVQYLPHTVAAVHTAV